MSLIDETAQNLSRLSDDQIDLAVTSADAHQWPRDRHALDFEMAVERIRMCRDAVAGAVDNGSVASLPVAGQILLRDALGNVATAIEAIAAGTDQLQNLSVHTDALHTQVWQNRLAEHGERVVNLAHKTEQLTSLIAEAQRLRKAAASALTQADTVPTALEQARQAADTANGAAQQAQTALQQATEHSKASQTALTEATERNNQLNETLGQTRASQQEISTIREGLKRLYTESAEFRKRIATAEQQAETVVAETKERSEQTIHEHTSRTEALLGQLEANEARIRHALDEATGVSLFDSFDKRRDAIGSGKWLWARAAAGLAFLTIILVAVLAFTCKSLTPAFYFKLGVALPIGGLVWFCIAQYNHERRLEEEYAFKSNISLSLVPYKDLVATAFGAEDEAAKGKYAQFLTDSVGKVFTPPADQRAEVNLSALKSLGTEQLKQLTELLAAVAKVVRG